MGRLLSLLTIGIVLLILPVATASSQERLPLIPPKRFDHPFKGKLVEHLGDIQEVQMWCATMYGEPFPYLVEGCYRWETVARSPLLNKQCVAMKLLTVTAGPNTIRDRRPATRHAEHS